MNNNCYDETYFFAILENQNILQIELNELIIAINCLSSPLLIFLSIKY
jgi:hypothetical protein